jgi:hypothetical protein
MKISYHEITLEVFLHPYVIANGPKIVTQVQEPGWPYSTHYYFALCCHKDGEDKKDFPVSSSVIGQAVDKE